MFFQALGRRALGQLTVEPGIAAEVGAFALSGQVAALPVTMPASVGTFTLGGQDVAFIYVVGRNVVANSGTFALTGNDSSFGVGFPAGAGTFALTGQASRRLLALPSSAGSFALTGSSGLRRDLMLDATGTLAAPTGHVLFTPLGALSLGGSAAALQAGQTFAWTGQDIDFEVAATLTGSTGAFVFTFPTTEFTATAYPAKIRAFPRAGRGMRARPQGGGMTATTTMGRAVRARAFGG